MNHTATITGQWEDCGALRYSVSCDCGYSGMDADGRGCWQEGHNEVYSLDSTHADLLDRAFWPTTPGTLQAWQPGPQESMHVVEVRM